MAALPALAAPAHDVITVKRADRFLELDWYDAEDRLRGAISPVSPRAGDALHVSLQVGSFEGAEFQGPVTIALRRSGAPSSQQRTVPFDGKGWSADFVAEDAGRYDLDVAFRTTRLKSLRATLDVAEPPVPRWLAWAVVVLGAAGALAYGLRLVLRKDGATPSPGPPPSPQ